jgi:hypothetical protein
MVNLPRNKMNIKLIGAFTRLALAAIKWIEHLQAK